MDDLNIEDGLTLKPIKLLDSQEFFALIEANRSYLREWLGWLDHNKSIDELENFIQSTLQAREKETGFCYLIWQDEKIVGIIHLVDVNKMNKKASIGYWVGEAFRGQGIATRATRRLCDWAFGDLKLNRLEIRCAPGNSASQAVPKKLGFLEEGRLRDNEWLYDHFVDHLVFSCLASEWGIEES